MNFGTHFFAVLFRRFHCLAQAPVAQRIHGGKAEIFEFETDIVDAQALGDRGIDISESRGRCAGVWPALKHPRVRILCSRSASLTRTTRISRDMARVIFLKAFRLL